MQNKYWPFKPDNSGRFARRFRVVAILFSVFLSLPVANAAEATGFQKWLNEFKVEAKAAGIRPEILNEALDGIKAIPRVIELDHKQPEFTLTFPQYLARVVPDSRVKKGRQRLAENRALLEAVSTKYGVQSKYIVAFWGIETDFGRITGGFKLVPALATLAYDGRRSAYFRTELLNALKILNEDHIKAKDMVGSWAGAMGQCQFMPSSFLNFAVDYNGDGRKDIWTTKADVFASAANYLSRSGWKGDQTWGRAVTLPSGFNLGFAGLKIRKPISEWQKLGVRRLNGHDLPKRDLMASVVLVDGPGSPSYMVYDNFRTIMKWNRSTYFAVAVGTLAEKIGGR